MDIKAALAEKLFTSIWNADHSRMVETEDKLKVFKVPLQDKP